MAEEAGAGGAVFDLSRRGKLRMTGADRFRYLNGQISNDLRKATEGSAVHACVLSAKGKIDAEVFIAAEGESFLIDTDPQMGEKLSARLERYIIADDAQIEDVTESFALLHVIGGEVPPLVPEGRRTRAERFGVLGTDIWLASASHEKALRELSQLFSFCDEEQAERFRIERGLPRYGHELTDEIIPTEANLEESVIDYAKGCYIGQEVISRIKMSGQTNKRLCGLVSESQVLLAGMGLVTPGEKKEVGWITSVAPMNRLGKPIALAFIKRGFQTLGEQLHAVSNIASDSSSPVAVRVVALPFV